MYLLATINPDWYAGKMDLDIEICTVFENGDEVTYRAEKDPESDGYLLHTTARGVVTTRKHPTKDALDAAYTYAKAYRNDLYKQVYIEAL